MVVREQRKRARMAKSSEEEEQNGMLHELDMPDACKAMQCNAMQWKASEIAYASWRPRPSLYRGADRGTEITHRGGEI
jgi:hypothetical protein